MTQVAIKFKTLTISSALGTFSDGDILRCSKAEADHFVNDCGAAEYLNAPVVAEAPAVEAEKPARKKKGEAQ